MKRFCRSSADRPHALDKNFGFDIRGPQSLDWIYADRHGSRSEGASQVALLHHISSIVSSDLSLEKMLQELVSLTLETTRCDACLVYLVDRATNEVVLQASQLPHASEIGNIRLKMGEGITGWVAQHKSVVALSNKASADARFKTFQTLPEDTFDAFLSVPLVSGGDLIGVINVHHRDAHSHSPEEVALVSFIGEQMGGAIAKSRLEERSETAAKRMETLAAVAQTISAENYLDRILQAISEMVAETLDSPVCSIMLIDEERRELVISAARCSSPDYLHKMPLKIEDSLIGRVVREGRPIMVPNVLAEKQYRYPELARKTGLASLLSVPLFTRDKVIGTINIYTREQRTFFRRRNRLRESRSRAGRHRHRERAPDVGNAGDEADAGGAQAGGARQGHSATEVQPHRRRSLPAPAQRKPAPAASHAGPGRGRDSGRRPAAGGRIPRPGRPAAETPAREEPLGE